jgi:hypothetical protein
MGSGNILWAYSENDHCARGHGTSMLSATRCDHGMRPDRISPMLFASTTALRVMLRCAPTTFRFHNNRPRPPDRERRR